MSVLRQANILGQQRLDVPHVRAIESSICADFDLLAGKVLAGERPLVVRGFDIITTLAVGNAATDLQLNVANGVILHPTASEAGTIFSMPSTASVEVLSNTNANVTGGFTANQVNYIGLDLRRSAATSTTDLVMFLDANTLLETPKSVPLARVLTYKIVISTNDFSSTPYLLPIAKVTTNSTNIVTALEDARPMMNRLGSGGSVPNRQYKFPWALGRQETTSGAVFSGGDKALASLKDWQDAVMTRLWELGGGQYWYSGTSDREVKLAFGQPTISATGDNFQWTLGTQTLQWQSLSVVFGNSPVAYNPITDGSAVLQDNQCLYVDIDRTSLTARTAQVQTLTALGQPTIPGSRVVIAWRRGSNIYVRDRGTEVGRSIAVATTTASGTVKLKYAAGTPSDPVVLAQDANGSVQNTATVNNVPGFKGTGSGSGAGVEGVGGGTDGPGLKGTGTGTGAGVEATASSSSNPAIKAVVGYADLPTIDRAGTITIGTTNSTGVTIGRTGQTTTVNGTLAAATIDLVGAMSIGTTSTTTITIGRTGQALALNSGTVTSSGVVTLNGGAGALKLKAGSTLDHIYTEWYARSSAQNTRSGYIGYSASGATTLDIANELASGNVLITPGTSGAVTIGRAGGTVGFVGTTTITGNTSVTGTVNATETITAPSFAGSQVIEAKTSVTSLNNGWSVSGVGCWYYKDNAGRLHLYVNAAGGTVGIATPLFQLPVGYRPAIGGQEIPTNRFVSGATQTSMLYIDASGNVSFYGGGFTNGAAMPAPGFTANGSILLV